ncbi:hypothetical protein [Williamsia sp.]|uniref:hypothetical protein n=1 Tax=Williamsia sp. TaxID=1872085 RepID=UPI002F91ECB3
MRTAVLRINVDPEGVLDGQRLSAGMAALRSEAAHLGAELIDVNLALAPAGRREIELLMTGDNPDVLHGRGLDLCESVFGVVPLAGVVTFISRGTDDDAHGVLAGFGLTADIVRTAGPDGWDVVVVSIAEADLDRVPESRIHTALEASLNCEVWIRAV